MKDFSWELIMGFAFTSAFDYIFIQKPLETKLKNAETFIKEVTDNWKANAELERQEVND